MNRFDERDVRFLHRGESRADPSSCCFNYRRVCAIVPTRLLLFAMLVSASSLAACKDKQRETPGPPEAAGRIEPSQETERLSTRATSAAPSTRQSAAPAPRPPSDDLGEYPTPEEDERMQRASSRGHFHEPE